MSRPAVLSLPARRLALAAPAAAGLALAAAVIPAGLASAATTGCTTSGSQVTCVFTETGTAQSWTVPAGVTSAGFTLYGAEGGSNGRHGAGGLGAEVTATLPLTPGTMLQVNVGQAAGADGTVALNSTQTRPPPPAAPAPRIGINPPVTASIPQPPEGLFP